MNETRTVFFILAGAGLLAIAFGLGRWSVTTTPSIVQHQEAQGFECTTDIECESMEAR